MAQAKTTVSVSALAELLHASPAQLEFLSGLSGADQKKLAADIQAAHSAHARHIKEKMEEALGHLPWLIRGPVRKLFGV